MSKGIPLDEAEPPLVLGLDVGSTACRGALYDAHGRPIGKRVKIPHSFTAVADGTSTIDPDQVVDELSQILDVLADRVRPGLVEAVAFDSFASSLVAVDRDGTALTPCFTYADGRCAAQVEQLRAEADEHAVQQLTGTRIHSSYWPARLRWLSATRPDLTPARYLSLGDYVYRRLIGVHGTGTACASWTGLVDRRACDWSADVIDLAGISPDQLPPIHHLDDPFTPIGRAADESARRWPAIAGARWFAPVSDGLSANVGLGAADSTTIGATGATSGALRVIVDTLPAKLPPGLWCYAVSAQKWIVGGALNDVGRATDWLAGNLAADQLTDDAIRTALLAEPSETTPLVLPCFTGERSTGWAADARAIMTGVSAASSATDIYRGVVEGIALSYARIARQLRPVAPGAVKIAAGGRAATARPELFQAVSDVLGLPIEIVDAKRTTLLGTARLALDIVAPSAGPAPSIERWRPEPGQVCEPHPGRAPYYADRAERFEAVYEALITSRG